MLVDDHAFYRSAMAHELNREPDLSVVAEASSVTEARTILNELGCAIDFAVLDLHLPDGSGIDVIRHLQASCPASKALVVAGTLEHQDKARALEAGAIGYLSKRAALPELIALIRRGASGESLVEPSEMLDVLRGIRQDRQPASQSETTQDLLTERERQVLAAMADGLTDREMARHFQVSPATVHSHVTNVLGKLGVHSRSQAIVAGVRARLIQID
jgi:DNA-binding NarL/FixJ family response regulator